MDFLFFFVLVVFVFAKLKGSVYWNPCVWFLVCQGAQHCFSFFSIVGFGSVKMSVALCCKVVRKKAPSIVAPLGCRSFPRLRLLLEWPQVGSMPSPHYLPLPPPLPTALFSTLGPAVPAPAHRVLHARFGVLVRLFPVPAGLLAIPARPFTLLTGSFSTRIQVPCPADGQPLHVQHAGFCTGLAKTFTRPNTLSTLPARPSTIPARLITKPATVLDCHPNLLDQSPYLLLC